jgi:hypothetical protein
LVQNAIFEDFMSEDFWFKSATFGSGGTFGARPPKVFCTKCRTQKAVGERV